MPPAAAPRSVTPSPTSGLLQRTGRPWTATVLAASGDHGDARGADPSLDAWVGGSVLGSLDGAADMWATQHDYEEGGGPLGVEGKCPLRNYLFDDEEDREPKYSAEGLAAHL